LEVIHWRYVGVVDDEVDPFGEYLDVIAETKVNWKIYYEYI
jgi:hypothetical protein